ncbi:23S rRNA (uracil-5-)-methyltransferase RumA, partial [Lacticaseibacillus saniviri]|nr:23S rRNA (uracil-5-)-methyltransferase RumA [Lacticaseibacillus saniviri]
GLDSKFIDTLLTIKPKKFVYISCNPSTLARDLTKLSQVYHVDYIQSIDMFPQTARCEAVVKFTRI